MKRRRMAIAVTGIAVLGLVLVVGFIATGSYNVAASTPHTRLTRWLLNTVQERSVAVRADDVPSPPPLDSEMAEHGFEEYRAMCAACHGAPGIERSELGKGMNPEPPDLAKEAVEWSDRQLFWITKHGIKLAGMPAFGVTHSDEELWGIVAFLRRLESMSPEEYRRLADAADAHPAVHATATEPPGELHGTVASPQAATQETGPARARHTHVREADQPQRRSRAAARPATESAQADTGATQKLKALATELMRDSLVMERIRSDTALRRRWEDENVRRHLTSPPGVLHE